MRVINFSNGVLELNFMWLPTFIGQNYHVMRQLQDDWRKEFGTQTLATGMALNTIHLWTIDWLCTKFPIAGLREYLKAIENVKEDGGDAAVHAHDAAG